MASLNLNDKSYLLNNDVINEEVTKNKIGNYALGKYDSKENIFYVNYVGRSDECLNNRLLNHVSETEYSHFKYKYADSKKGAFQRECENYHDFGENKKLKNEIHPDRPKDTNWKCPRCDIFNG